MDRVAGDEAARRQDPRAGCARYLDQLRRASRTGRRTHLPLRRHRGRERVIAGSDCGFGTFAGYGKLDPDISFKKLRAMAEGAAIASKRLWGRA
jgi:hypothetical protein